MKVVLSLISTRDSRFDEGCSLVATALPRDRQGLLRPANAAPAFPAGPTPGP